MSRIFVFVLILALVDGNVFKHELSWRPSRFEQMLKRGEYSAYLEYKKMMLLKDPWGYFTSEQTLSDHIYYEYMGNITIGMDDQPFTVVFDTSSANLFVPGMDCTENCETKRKFNPSTSETFRDTRRKFIVNYFSGNASGSLGSDFVALGDASENQLIIPKTLFGIAKNVPADFKYDPKEGIFGMAFASLTVGSITPPLINAINQGLLSEPIFTTWFNYRGQPNDVTSGAITYGALDTEHCGDIIAHQPLTTASYFQFKTSSFSLGAYSDNKVYEAIVDSATSFLCGPQAVVNALAKAAGAVYDEQNQVYNIDCSSPKEPLKLTIGKHVYEIEPENYTIKWDVNSCLFAAIPQNFAGFAPNWILGLPFLRQYCVVHDLARQRLGFALSVPSR